VTTLYLTSTTADAAVVVGTGTNWLASTAAAASARTVVKQAGSAPPYQVTDGTGTTDGTVVSWYSQRLAATTITGTCTCTLFDQEVSTSTNAAPVVQIERCGGDGTVLATIVASSVNEGAGEMTTTSASDTVTISAANMTDTALTDGDRLRISLWIGSASAQGGSGTLTTTTTHYARFWVNSATCSLAFTETLTAWTGPFTLTGTASSASSTTAALAATWGLAGTSGGAQGTNLLSANASSMETDGSCWGTGANSTVTYDSTQAHSGTHAMKITATASGAASSYPNSGGYATVTPSTAYNIGYWMYTGTAGLSSTPALDWYNGTTYVSTLTGAAQGLTQNGWTFVTFAGSSPGTATVARIYPAFTATAGAQAAWFDDVIITTGSLYAGQASSAAGSLVPLVLPVAQLRGRHLSNYPGRRQAITHANYRS